MPQKGGRGARRRVRVTAPDQRNARDVRVRQLIDQGVDELQRERTGPAQRKFRQALGLSETSADARAFLALTHALQHQWEKATGEALAVLQDERDHLIALTALARAHFGAGRPVEANQAALQALRRFYGRDQGITRSSYELVLVADMLVFMEAHRRLHQLYRRSVRGRPGRREGLLSALFGIASFNCGQYRDARWAWRDARLQSVEQAQLFTSYLFVAQLVEQGRIPPFLLDYRLRSSAHIDEETEVPGFLKVFALHNLWHAQGEETQRAALDLLSRDDEEWAASFLLTVVRDPDLPDQVKLHAGTMLMDFGLVPEDDPLEMHLDGELQPVSLHTEKMELDLDAATAAFFGQAVEADAKGMGATAEAGYRAVLEVVPSFVPALVGLAAICERSGRLEEAEDLLADALQAEPFSPMIRFHLAALHMQQERFGESWQLLQTVSAPELPPGVRSVYHWLRGRLALVLNRAEQAEAAFEKGLQEDPDNDELLSALIAARRAVANRRQQLARSSARRRKRHEDQTIAADVSWVDALSRLTVPRLQAIARHIGIDGIGSLRKADVANHVADVLREELGAVWHALSLKEQAALRWIDARGGCVPYAELRRRFGDDTEDSIDWLEAEPETVPMRLQFHGLVFVGRLLDKSDQVAVVPPEARQALKFAGSRKT